MYTIHVLPVILIIIGGLTSPAPWQTPHGPQGTGPRRPPVFADVDKNADGRISREEWQGPSEVFDHIDANKDGYISQDEFKAAPRRGPGGPPHAEQLLAALDSNGDGAVSQAEFGQITQLFDKLDQNKDGALTQAELEGFIRGPGLQMAARAGSGPIAGGPRHPPDFATLDSNGDKKISRDEWHGPPELFDRLDADHNGILEESESKEGHHAPPAPGGGFGARIVKFLDADGDEKVSQAEFAALARLFNTLDTNQDGSLTKEELAGFFQAVG